ncbi:MAG: FtsX-like permease family protein [Planctomycetota bacterium]
MYKLVLISKYLRRKLAPLFAALAVTICTAMVVIVISVMGGFLDLMRTTAKTLTGEVIVESRALNGFPHYQEMIERVEQIEGVDRATPMIETFALMKIGNGTSMIRVHGVQMPEMASIINYEDTLLWDGEDYAEHRGEWVSERAQRRLTDEVDLHALGMRLEEPVLIRLYKSRAEQERVRAALLTDRSLRDAWRTSPRFPLANVNFVADPDAELLAYLETPRGLSLIVQAVFEHPELLELPGMPRITQTPGAVIGVAINPYQQRDEKGKYHFADPETGFPRSYAGGTIDLTFAPLTPSGDIGAFEPVRKPITVVNEFQSGYYENDISIVYVPMDWLQRQLQMQESRDLDESTIDPVTGLGGDEVITPGRVHAVWIKTAEGYDEEQVAARVDEVVQQMQAEHSDMPILFTLTWEDKHAALLGAVQNEKGLVTFLFVIISIVAIVMVATTFYMIVLEKTRDIGVLRAIGAPSTGVLNLFLIYGLAIGVIGAAAGVGLAWFTVTNLNNLQDALANRMATLIGSVGLSFVLALVLACGLAYPLRWRDFGLGGGALVFLIAWGVLLAGVYYGFPSISLPIAAGLDPEVGWRMWDPQTYFFEKIPDRVNPTEAISIGIGAVISSVLGAIVPALIAARLNPVEALRYE